MSFAATSARGWVWIESEVLYAVHAEQLAEHGGLEGVRDTNAFESALARPEQLAHYGNPDAADLAAGELTENEFAHWLRQHLI